MVYKTIITERADELLEQLIYYLAYRLKNEQAASHLLDGISKIYDRVEENPFKFPECRDLILKSKGYREVVVTDMNYLVIFRVDDDTVYILGIFHELENYNRKL